jgi:23S rRNA pseudouridine2605 synthase
MRKEESTYPETTIRLNRYLALCNIASRRKSEAVVRSGRVKVNGTVVTEPSYRVVIENDAVRVDEKRVRPSFHFSYILFYKPPGVIVSEKDDRGRKTVRDFLPSVSGRIKPVGRMDYWTEGLLLLSDDGKFAYRVSHPRFGVEKTYLVKVRGRPDPGMLVQLRSGVPLSDGYSTPCSVKVRKYHSKNTVLEISLSEGRNRQVRRMMQKVGLTVLNLKRTAIGNLNAGRMRRGDWRYLTCEERMRVFQK